eukprot:6104_1
MSLFGSLRVSKRKDESISTSYIKLLWKHAQLRRKNTNFMTTRIQQSQMNCKEKRISMRDCESCRRVSIILKHHQQEKQNNTINRDIDIFDLTSFQNDMNHIITHHDTEVNNQRFIHNAGPCTINNCRIPSRGSRRYERESPDTIRDLLFEEYHSYLFHPITTNTRTHGSIYPDRNTRFVAIAPVQIDENEQKTSDTKSMDEPHFFRFGYKFAYHKYKRDLSSNSNYVGCRYRNLKEELTKDTTKRFSIENWNMLIAQCQAHRKTDYSKSLKAKENVYGWNTEIGKAISLARIVAIVLYTNYDHLTTKLCQTYRKDIGDYKQQKHRHSSFAHWAKLLRSTVDLFGQRMNSRHVFHRGLRGNNYVFSLFSTDFNAPCSTTTSVFVAWNFAVNGIVVQIKKSEWRDGARFMKLQHFSAFKSEKEHLFIGEDNFLKISCIHRDLSQERTCTEPLVLLQLLTRKIDRQREGNRLDIVSWIQYAPRLCHNLMNRHCADDYGYQLTNNFVNRTRKVYITVKLMQDLVRIRDCVRIRDQKEECQELLSWFIDGSVDVMDVRKEFQVNVERLIDLFPNVRELQVNFRRSNMRMSEDEVVNKSWCNIVSYLCKYWPLTKTKTRISKIIIERLRKFPSEQFINQMREKLKCSRWRLDIVPKKTNALQIKCIIFYRYACCPM